MLSLIWQAPLGVPELQKVNQPAKEEIPRWSIRRSICPVCSQKWRDKSSISNVKYSGTISYILPYKCT